MFYICSPSPYRRPPPCPSPSNPPRPRRAATARPRREAAARQRRAEREARIVSLLNRGVSVAEIADRDGVGERAMRKTIRTLLARRAPAPPAEFLALQVSRLNEALFVASGAMSAVNLEAVDRVVKIVRELDRYHGFAIQAAPPKPLRLLPPSHGPTRARGAGRPRGTNWRRNRLKTLNSRAGMAPLPQGERVLLTGSTGRSPARPLRSPRAARHAPKGRRGGRRRAGPSPPPRERTARGERPRRARSRTAQA